MSLYLQHGILKRFLILQGISGETSMPYIIDLGFVLAKLQTGFILDRLSKRIT